MAERARVSLFQRIRKPFGEMAEDDVGQPEEGAHAIGELLRERREELGLELGAIGDALRIKPVYLAAIEEGRVQDLPGPTYAIGFVRAYSHYLGLDSERVLDSYKAESADVQARPDLSLPVPLGARSLPGGPILLVGLILALCGYGAWYYLATGERSRPERVAAVPAELRSLVQPAVTAAPDVAPAKAEGAAAGAEPATRDPPPRFGTGLGVAEPPPAAVPGGPALVASPVSAATAAPPGNPMPAAPRSGGPAVAMTEPSGATPPGDGAAKPRGQVELRATADCWIQVRTADQTVVFSRVLKAGETYRVPGPGLFLRTGNAGALAIAVDGQPVPPIGEIGALRRNVSLEPDALLAGTAVRG